LLMIDFNKMSDCMEVFVEHPGFQLREFFSQLQSVSCSPT